MPALSLPSFGQSLQFLTGALAVAVVIAVQAAGVSQSAPNPAGARASTSRDFAAMGLANVASGLLRGLPVGGSLSATALSLLAGARSRWAAVLAGIWMALLVVVLPQAVSPIAMPSLAALLVLAGARTLQPAEVLSIWRTGWSSRVAILTTFFSMLFLPVQAAVGIGVALSVLLSLGEAAVDVVVVERRQEPDGSIQELRAPARLPSDAVTVLQVYGQLFYAGARTLEEQLPRPHGTRNSVVVLRLRGRTHVGATLVEVLSQYAEELRRANGCLYLSGLSDQVHREILRTGKLDLSGPVQAYEATPVVGQATRDAVSDAQAWLAARRTTG